MRWKPRYHSDMFLLLLALIFLSIRAIDACSCSMEHPQTKFCRSEFVALVRVVKKFHVSPEEIAYMVKVNKIYKDETHNFNPGCKYIYTAAQESLCGAENLQINEKYVISASVYSGKPWISLCSMKLHWPQVTSRQRKGLRDLYAKNCKCKISYTDWRNKGKVLDKTGNKSCLWESAPGPEVCQEKYGICQEKHEWSGCSWVQTMSYKNCIKEHIGLRLREQQPKEQ